MSCRLPTVVPARTTLEPAPPRPRWQRVGALPILAIQAAAAASLHALPTLTRLLMHLLLPVMFARVTRLLMATRAPLQAWRVLQMQGTPDQTVPLRLHAWQTHSKLLLAQQLAQPAHQTLGLAATPVQQQRAGASSTAQQDLQAHRDHAWHARQTHSKLLLALKIAQPAHQTLVLAVTPVQLQKAAVKQTQASREAAAASLNAQ